uniref:Uncharacterized protein n=1 Tax=Cucumis melo TaxID=3656 RepID=A0A9I9CPA5_CUCME
MWNQNLPVKNEEPNSSGINVTLPLILPHAHRSATPNSRISVQRSKAKKAPQKCIYKDRKRKYLRKNAGARSSTK